MLRAIIFDFDGIIVNSEPLIVKLTQQMAGLEGWTITEEEYYRDYLALDDRGIVEHLFRSQGRSVDRARRDELIEWKTRAYWEAIRDGLPSFPDAIEFVRNLPAHLGTLVKFKAVTVRRVANDDVVAFAAKLVGQPLNLVHTVGFVIDRHDERERRAHAG